MQQLQSDVLQVKHLKVEFMSHREKGGTPLRTQKTEAETPKTLQSTKKGATKDNPPSKTHVSRWIEKLKLEKSNKTKKQSSLQQKLRDKTAAAGAAKISKGNFMGPGTSKKTISTAKRSKQPKPESTTSPKPSPHQVQHLMSKHGTSSASLNEDPEELSRAAELAEVEELEEAIGDCASSNAEKLLEDKDGNHYGDLQLNLRCYLEACVFTGDVEQAQRCLFFHHRHLSRRKSLSITAYNIMIRMWAKKVRPYM